MLFLNKREINFLLIAVCSRHKEWAEKTLADVVVAETGHLIDPPPINNRLSASPDIITDISYSPESGNSQNSDVYYRVNF